MPCDQLQFDPANARKHPEPQLAQLRASLKSYGQRKPVVANRRTGTVEAGNGMLQAALSLGWSHLAAVYVDDDPATAVGFAIADNRIPEGAEWDTAALDALLRTCQTGDSELAAMFAKLAEEQKIIPAEPAPSVNGDGVDLLSEVADEDGLDLLFKAPFPYFGGKARVARAVWKRFGDVPNFIEPFFGSGAVLLNRPAPLGGVETVNDRDGLVANFWRALQAEPDEVTKWADWPVNENDLHARHAWLVARKDSLQTKLEGDPKFFEVKVAGWWVWGMACWIGSGFCSGQGPWRRVQDKDGQWVLANDAEPTKGAWRQLVHLSDAGLGVNRKLVHLGDAGRGVNRQRVHLSDAGRAGLGEQGLLAWMRALAERMGRVRVCCGDWTRVCGGKTGDALKHFFAAGQTCGIFLDPPYSAEAGRDATLYRQEDLAVAHAVREWAIEHGNDKRLRIALCGYEDEHKLPKGWKCLAWKTAGGFASQGKSGKNRGKANAFRERIWFSPHCMET